MDTEFYKLRIDNWKICLRKDFLKCNVKDLFLSKNKKSQEQSKFIKIPSSQYTNVSKCNIRVDGTIHSFYLKEYLCRSTTDFLKCLFRPSPAKRSYHASIILENNGFCAPVATGLFERCIGPFLIDNLLLTEEVKNAKSIVQCLADMNQNPSKDVLLYKRSLIECLGETIGQMHNKGIFHGDLRLGNVLVQQKENGMRFFFLDNERTKKFRRLPARLRLKNLVQINMLQGNIIKTDRMRFFKRYCAQNSLTKEAEKDLADHVLRKTEQRLRNRKNPTKSMKKYLRTNEKYLRIKADKCLAVFDRSFCQEPEALHFIRDIGTRMEQGDYIKKGDTSSVSYFSWSNKRIVIKGYKFRGFLYSIRHTIKRSRAYRSWVNGHRLLNLGIPTPKPLAYIEQRKRFLVLESYLVTEYVEGRNLARFEQDTDVSAQQISRIAEKVEKILERMATYQISHGDLKHTNILITPNGPVLTDLDAMKIYRLKSLYKFKQTKDIARFKRDLATHVKNNANRRKRSL
jgi:tRNA A-37 threonylcarbamoyl transferase component Bud32